MRSIRTKMLVLILIPTVIVVNAAMLFSAFTMRGELSKYAMDVGMRRTEQAARVVGRELTRAVDAAFSVGVLAESVLRTNTWDERVLPVAYERMLREQDFLFSAWTVYAPNVWGGSAASGEYAPRAFRSEDAVSVETAVEPETYSQAYYTAPMDARRMVLLDPYQRETGDGRRETMSSIAVPVLTESGKYAGAAGVDVSLATIQEVAQSVRLFDTGSSTLVTEHGRIVAHRDATQLGRQIADLESEATLRLIDASIEWTQTVTQSTNSPITGEPVFRVYAPVEIPRLRSSWVLIASVPEEAIFGVPRRLTALMVAFGVGVSAFVGALLFVMASGIAAPIRRLSESFGPIAEGDLTQRTNFRSRDEVGTLGGLFNHVSDRLRLMLNTVKSSIESLSSVGRRLAGTSSSAAGSIERIVEHVEIIRREIERQATSVKTSSSAVERITANVESLDQMIDVQSSGVVQSTASIEEMAASIESVSANVERMANHMRELVDASEVGRGRIADVSDQIKQIARQSETLVEANSIISSIAEQTNLLAMNAAIEAAHAGEAGKGFAVVAEEIRKLAESVTAQSHEIEQELSSTKSVIDGVVGASADSERAFADVQRLIHQVSVLEDEVKQSTLEQSAGSKQILEALSQINEITAQVKTGAGEMKEATTAVMGEMNALVEVSERVQSGMGQIGTATDDMSEAVRGLDVISQENRESIDRVSREIGQFKTSDGETPSPDDAHATTTTPEYREPAREGTPIPDVP
jgi:methyl-accepting chemotaxis protein